MNDYRRLIFALPEITNSQTDAAVVHSEASKERAGGMYSAIDFGVKRSNTKPMSKKYLHLR